MFAVWGEASRRQLITKRQLRTLYGAERLTAPALATWLQMSRK